LLGDPEWFGYVQELMGEVINSARAYGHMMPYEFAEEQIANTRIMSAYKPSTLVDFELGRQIELETLFLEPLRRARAKEVPTPRLLALCGVLSGIAQELEQARPESGQG
jgi:2-dehydropantoate 2-reductase